MLIIIKNDNTNNNIIIIIIIIMWRSDAICFISHIPPTVPVFY